MSLAHLVMPPFVVARRDGELGACSRHLGMIQA